ncbi:P-loop containing nucleoside triphosphate hydrolase protein [Lyophyllum atratum]|nr:P-loop containing nucleoside triphosphate hydrolase protein [Lyophyllum atratum]
MNFTPQPNDIVIPIMGITGSGKSTFINILAPEAGLVVGDDIDVCTTEVQPAVIAHPNDSAYRVVLIDTPGLDSTTCPDDRILRNIAQWLNQYYYKDRRLAGIIYLFEITQSRLSASTVLRNLAYFDGLCGSAATKNVILASTKWSPNPTEKEMTRQVDLANIRPGSRVHRFENTTDSAWAIVNMILADAFTFDTEALQEHVKLLGDSLKRKGNDQRLITELEASLQEQNRMAEQLKRAGGVQIGDGGLWEKLVENDKTMRGTLAQIGNKIPISLKIKSFFRLR